jgi:hypothetical protein
VIEPRRSVQGDRHKEIGMMNTNKADQLYATMRQRLDQLLGSPRRPVSAGNAWPKSAGVYAIFDAGECLYVGRTGDVRSRLKSHCADSSTHHKASFAFRLAREATGNEQATYKKAGGRAELASTPAFNAEFTRQRRRIGAMEAAFIELPNDETQAMFEIYAAMALRARHSKFNTH